MKIKNWNQFQHFKDRRPPWIKLHRSILEQRDINLISDCSFRVLVGLWLLASEDEQMEGNLPDIDDISFRLRIDQTKIIESLQELGKFVDHDDINLISARYQLDVPETETEAEERQRTETETEGRDRGRAREGKRIAAIRKKWTAPNWLHQPAWQEWDTWRKKHRPKGWSDIARTKAANKLKGLTPEQQQQTVDNSIESGWPGLYPEKVRVNGSRPQRRTGGPRSPLFAEELRTIEGECERED